MVVSKNVEAMKEPVPAMTVPLLDLRSQYQSIKDEIRTVIDGVLETQQFILGAEVEALEQEIAQYCGCRFAIGVSSGTDALLVSMMALGISKGDEVLTTPFTFFATVGSVLRLGALAAFADIRPDSFNIDPAEVEKAINASTKAIIPVHLFGQSADMEPILHVAEKHGIPVIEDAAQAIGSEYRGRRVGSMGTVGCFSFFPSKNLGAFGDGGMVTTSDPNLAERIRMMRNHGSVTKYDHAVLGGNFRLDALQAAVLRVKLKYLDSWTGQRRQNAAFYTRRFQELGLAGNEVVSPEVVHERHIYNQYVIHAKDRDELKEFLKDKGVATEIYYPKSLHIQECMPDGRYRAGDFPVTEAACSSVLALPIYSELTLEQKEYVVSTIAEFYRR